MTFRDLSRAAQELADIIADRTGRPLVVAVTVPEPEEPLDELHFVRLVSWGYVLINEAGNTVFKELARFLKSTTPEVSQTYQDGRRNIEALRTSFFHLADERTKRVAEAWLLQNGDSSDWLTQCTVLQHTLSNMLDALRGAFLRLCEEADDQRTGLKQLLAAVDKAWAPYLFDDLVSEIADEIGLPPLDAVAFRKPRQERWAQLASVFMTREDGSIALRRIIRAELQMTFGAAPCGPRGSFRT